MDENAAGAAPVPGFEGAGREHPALWPLCVGGGGNIIGASMTLQDVEKWSATYF